MEIVFNTIYENTKPKGINFMINVGGCPNHKEIDSIIDRLQRLKNEMTDKEINEQNKKEWEEQMHNMEEANKLSHNDLKTKIKGYIYLLKSRNLYKIGRAKDIRNRIKTYKTENPFGIEVIFQKKVNDYVGVETKLLKKFKDKQIRGEWFELDKKDIQKIESFIN